ncbi:MAG: hypothetical protein E4H20_11835, partial [Spirochaetales bacterium]
MNTINAASGYLALVETDVDVRPDGAVEGPAWDLSHVFPSVVSMEYRTGMDVLRVAIDELEKAGAPIGARVTDAEKLDATRDASLMEACRRFADLLVSAYTLHGDL